MSETDKLYNKVKNLVESGMGRTRIARELGISDSKATRIIRSIRDKGDTGKFKKETLTEKASKYKEYGEDIFDIAKELKKTPSQVKSLLNKNNAEYSPITEWLRKASKKGIHLSRLTKELGIESLVKAEKILQETFTDCFIVKTKIDQEDYLLVPVKDSKYLLSSFDIDTNKRPFRVGIISHNYIIVKVDDSIPTDKLTFFDLTDIHVGSRKFRKEAFIETLKEIKKDPGALILLGGDDIEVITKFSVADPVDQYEGINDQVVEFLELINPVSDRLIVKSWGNHCGGRTEKAAQFDLARTIATMLKVPYFRERGIIEVHWRGQVKRISLTHKYGNASRKAQIESEVEKIRSWSSYEVSAYFSGHNHDAFISEKQTEILVPGQGLKSERYYICNGGSFIGRQDTYASREGYGPTPQDVVYYGFTDQGKDFVGRLELNSD